MQFIWAQYFIEYFSRIPFKNLAGPYVLYYFKYNITWNIIFYFKCVCVIIMSHYILFSGEVFLTSHLQIIKILFLLLAQNLDLKENNKSK